jgi:hypothetical protein
LRGNIVGWHPGKILVILGKQVAGEGNWPKVNPTMNSQHLISTNLSTWRKTFGIPDLTEEITRFYRND